MSIHPRIRRAGGLVAAAAIVVTSTTTAMAGPAEVEHYTWTDAAVFEAGEWDDGCSDLGFDVHWGIEETGVIVTQNRGRDGLWYYAARFRGVESWTNPVTGDVFSVTFNLADRDHKVVDNGDGTLTVLIQVAGPSRYALNGQRLFMNTGVHRFNVLIDHGGTPTDPSDDEFLDFLGFDKTSGLYQTDGRDFCADLQEFIG